MIIIIITITIIIITITITIIIIIIIIIIILIINATSSTLRREFRSPAQGTSRQEMLLLIALDF